MDSFLCEVRCQEIQKISQKYDCLEKNINEIIHFREDVS